MLRWLVTGILVLSLLAKLSAQNTIVIDSGFTYRQVVPGICSDPGHLCNYQKTVSWDDSQIKEFALREVTVDGVTVEFMNFRVLFPNGFNKNADIKYPMIVMLHGAGESGRSWSGHYDYQPDNVLYDNNGKNVHHGGKAHLDAVNRIPTASNAFPGFVIWPQVSHNGAWEGGWDNGTLGLHGRTVATFIEHLIAEYDVDPDRVAMHGLSNGAKGVWDLGAKRNDLFAAILPMSGTPRDYEAQANILVTTPIWLFQGGLDTNPSPGAAQNFIDLLIGKGGTPRYTLYPTLGHGTWNTAFAEPDFFSWILSQNKKNIHVFGGRAEICVGGILKLGFSDGFLEYQWTKDSVDLPNETSRLLNVTETGVYTVKFRRRTNDSWDESFPVEVIPLTQANSPLLTNSGSTALPIYDGSTEIFGAKNTVRLTAPLGSSEYKWYQDDTLYVTTTANFEEVSFNTGSIGDAGTYHVVLKELNGCPSLPSNPITLTWNDPQPSADPSWPRPTLTSLSSTELEITWTDVAGETAYEIWQFRRPFLPDQNHPYPGENWKLLTILPANTTSYISKGLRPIGQYQFYVRAMSSEGGAFSLKAPQSGSHTMPEDVTAPTAPTDLIVTNVNDSQITIAWSASKDNDVVYKYEVFDGPTKVTEIFNDNVTDLTNGDPPPATTYTYTGLMPLTTYLLNVRAVDFRGNVSPFSEGIEVTTTDDITNGVAYKYFEFSGTMPGTSGAQLAEFNYDQPPLKAGIVGGFNISVRNRDDRFVVCYEGYIQIDQAGDHRFYTRSNEGSRLDVKNNPGDAWTNVVDNDGIHSTTIVSNTHNFPATGRYPIRVTYFEQTSVETLTVKYHFDTTLNNYDSPSALSLTGANTVLFTGPVIKTFYSKSTGDLSTLSTWGSNSDGTGTAPLSFTEWNQHFILANRTTVDFTSPLPISGNGSRIIVGDGVTPITLNLELSSPLTAMLEAQGNAVINVNSGSIPTFGSLSEASTLNFNVAGTIPNGSYGNLNLNTAETTKTLPLSTFIVKGQLTAQDSVTIVGAPSNMSVINVGGNITLNGSSGQVPAPTEKYSLAFSGATSHTINLNGFDLNVYSLAAGFGDIININNNLLTPPNVILSGGNLILKGGSVLNVGSGNFSLTGNGCINPNDETGIIAMNGGEFIFQSTTPQNSSVTFDAAQNTVNNFTYEAPANVNLTLTSPLKVKNVVSLSQGQLNTGGGNLTLVSNVEGTARIGPLGSNARIVGNVNFQRYMDGEGRIYRYISSPVKGATVADLQEYIPVTGNFEGKSVIEGVTSGASMYQYDEPNIGEQGWKAFPTVTNQDSLRRGKGYAVFVREAEGSTIWELTGTPIQGNVAFYLTPDTGSSNDGWNLLGNPYATPIQWTNGITAGWTSQGVGDFVWIRENSGMTSGWKTWGSGTGDSDFSGIIAPGQAFWVQTNSASPTMTISETAKYAGQGNFYRTVASYTNSLTIAVSNGTLTDKTYIQSRETGSDIYRKTEDAVKQPNSYFNLSSKSSDGILLAINIVAEEFCEKPVSINLDNADPGNYTISFKGLETFYHGLKTTLKDKYTGTEHPVTENYTYSFSVTTDPLSKGFRFVVVMDKPEVKTDLPVSGSGVCERDAVVKIEGAQPGVLYQLFDGETALSEKTGISNSENVIEFPVLKDLVGYGSSDLRVKAGFAGCNNVSLNKGVTVVIDTLAKPEISLTQNDNLIASISNADSYKWFFNGNLIPEETGPDLIPSEIGAYYVEVTRGACSESSDVFNYLATGVEGQQANSVSIYPNPFDGRITVYLNGNHPKEIVLHDMVGKILYHTEVKPTEEYISLDLKELPPGAFILNVGTTKYKVIKKN